MWVDFQRGVLAALGPALAHCAAEVVLLRYLNVCSWLDAMLVMGLVELLLRASNCPLPFLVCIHLVVLQNVFGFGQISCIDLFIQKAPE